MNLPKEEQTLNLDSNPLDDANNEFGNLHLKMGLEIHATIDTQLKAFSRTDFNSNSLTSLGLQGTLPQINTDAIKAAIRVSKTLNMIPPLEIGFERKAYFYFDLPRGYQITQYLNPVGKNGYIFLPKLSKKINISSVALEEDTASHSFQKNKYILSPDRLGVPLIEIVTKPDFETIEEVIECVKWIRLLLFFVKASKAEFEKGHLRVDLNISLENQFSEIVTGRIEVKNLASYKAIEGAAKEVKAYLLEKLASKDKENIFKNWTCGWQAENKKLVIAREKKTGSDYFFVPESAIPSIKLEKKELREITKGCDQNVLTNIYDTINSSSLASREREEITSNFDFFWDCYEFYKVLQNWTHSFFILKIFQSAGSKQDILPSILNFLKALLNEYHSKYPQEKLKFNKWKIKECFKRINNNPKVKLKEVTELYFSLPAIQAEDIVNLCEKILIERKTSLLKLVERDDKLSTFLLGQIKSNFKDKVEMSEAQTIVSQKLDYWKKSFLTEENEIKENSKEGGENN